MKLSDLPSPYIIAEVGSCWRDFDEIKNSITLAKNCGADAVKFQLFTPKELYGQGATVETGQPPYFHHGWLAGLKEKCDATGIDLLCSAFSIDGLKAVDPYVKMHKLASSENNHLRMLQRLRELGKPVLLSTGGSSYADVQKSVEVLTKRMPGLPDPVEVMPLYCVSDYPARRIDLRNISRYRELGSGFVGYSDHSIDSLAVPLKAVELGAQVIEKHVNFFGVECPDSPHSLSKEDFKNMCSALKGREFSDSGQNDMILKHNRRLVAIKDIGAGETLTENVNFGIFRSLKENTDALSPFHVDVVNGKQAIKEIKAGDGIGPGSFR